jgi:hypothetical protein
MSKHYPVEQRERAVKTVLDHLDEYRSGYAHEHQIRPRGLLSGQPLGLAPKVGRRRRR